jgi:hypothetical protein
MYPQLVHDMSTTGISGAVAHKIVVEDDLRDVGRKMSGIVSGIVEPNQGKLEEHQ